MDYELTTMWLSVDPMADKYPSISPYAYCMWNPLRLIDPDGMDTIRINVTNGSFEHTKADGDHSVQYYKNGELAYTERINSNECFFFKKIEGFDHGKDDEGNDYRTNHLFCSNTEIGDGIFRKIAEIGSPVEWDYYAIANERTDISYGDLSSSGISNKVLHGNPPISDIRLWNHYHPNINSESFYPSYSDQDFARRLKEAQCFIFNNGRSMEYKRYIPLSRGYISVHKFRDLWYQFAK